MVFSLQSLCFIHSFKKNKYSLKKKMKVAAKYCILGENTPDTPDVNAPLRQEEYLTFLIRIKDTFDKFFLLLPALPLLIGECWWQHRHHSKPIIHSIWKYLSSMGLLTAPIDIFWQIICIIFDKKNLRIKWEKSFLHQQMLSFSAWILS